jgi:hypothetical protein
METSVMTSTTARIVTILTGHISSIDQSIAHSIIESPDGLPFIKAAAQYDAQGTVNVKTTFTAESMTVAIGFDHAHPARDASEMTQRYIFDRLFAENTRQIAEALGFA